MRVLKFLRFTRDCGRHYIRYLAILEKYNDVNWISNIKDSKFHIGYVFTMGEATISWKLLSAFHTMTIIPFSMHFNVFNDEYKCFNV